LLHIVGRSDCRIFGLEPAERLRRQVGADTALLVADANAVLDDAAVRWLIENPGQVLASDRGKALAVVVEPGTDVEGALCSPCFPVQTAGTIGARYIKKLRRKSPLLAVSLDDTPVRDAERLLFDKVYKGVTDLVTKYVWPFPALVVTRAAALAGISPNFVTIVGMVLMLIASWLFLTGQMALGLVAAWGMTFLDTVDGKLARVTVTSSKLGDLLDHGTDIIHPPLWWLCLGYGMATAKPAQAAQIGIALWVILGCYIAGRVIEIAFRRRFGFNPYMWQPFDSRFRLIVSRRNIILLIMTIGLIAGVPVQAFTVCGAWSLISVLIQAARYGQAMAHSRREPVRAWLG
jgi:phosphatidylglycerophosphate synthase